MAESSPEPGAPASASFVTRCFPACLWLYHPKLFTSQACAFSSSCLLMSSHMCHLVPGPSCSSPFLEASSLVCRMFIVCLCSLSASLCCPIIRVLPRQPEFLALQGLHSHPGNEVRLDLPVCSLSQANWFTWAPAPALPHQRPWPTGCLLAYGELLNVSASYGGCERRPFLLGAGEV